MKHIYRHVGLALILFSLSAFFIVVVPRINRFTASANAWIQAHPNPDGAGASTTPPVPKIPQIPVLHVPKI